MKKQIQYLGIDVDDQKYHGCVMNLETGEVHEFVCKPNSGALRQKIEKLGILKKDLKICYEAGYLGFSLCRQLRAEGYSCDVIAPSLIPEVRGDQIKTDRLDAERLARYYMRGDLTIVHVPDEEDESIRDLIRSRGFLVKENRQIKTHILSLCRRIGLDYRKEHGVRSNYWTELHRIWLQKQIKGLRQRAHQINMAHLLMTLHQIEQTIDLYDQEILELSKQSKYQKPMEALRCFRSIGTLTAMTITTELGDIRRFNHPEKLTSYAGLDLREYSSGGKEKKFGITHLGNKYLRTAVVEASQLAAYRPSISRDLKRRREGASAKSIEIADRCMKRLYKRSDHLLRRGKHPNKVKVAAARELLSFIWEALRAAA